MAAVCARPEIKKRAALSASGDKPVLTVRLLKEEDPLKLAKGVVELFAAGTEK